MLTTPLDFLPEVAEQVLPGCRYMFGPDEEKNIDADEVPDGQDIFYVDDYMPVKMTIDKGGQLIATYTVSFLLLAISQPTDPAPLRWPRVTRMIDAGARLLRVLNQREGVKAVLSSPGVPLYNQFDRNADGVSLTFEITPPDTLNYIC